MADARPAVRTRDAARRLLQAHNNSEQAYSDRGIRCCYPFYHQKAIASAYPQHPGVTTTGLIGRTGMAFPVLSILCWPSSPYYPRSVCCPCRVVLQPISQNQ